MRKKNLNPNQPIVIAQDGCVRFKRNKLVDTLLDKATKSGYSLNNICRDFDCSGEYYDDYKQLMQLIGYSTSGYGDLSMIKNNEVRRADKIADQVWKEHKKDPLLRKAEEAVESVK